MDEDDFEYEQEFDYGDEPEFEAEIAARERVGISQGVVGDIYAQYRDDREFQLKATPYERFVVNVSTVINNLNLQASITDGAINPEYTKKIPNVEHKNPTAYVLGFIACYSSFAIAKKVLDSGELLERNVTEPDIVRYMKMCNNIQACR
jgi:hypothetical protein